MTVASQVTAPEAPSGDKEQPYVAERVVRYSASKLRMQESFNLNSLKLWTRIIWVRKTSVQQRIQSEYRANFSTVKLMGKDQWFPESPAALRIRFITKSVKHYTTIYRGPNKGTVSSGSTVGGGVAAFLAPADAARWVEVLAYGVAALLEVVHSLDALAPLDLLDVDPLLPRQMLPHLQHRHRVLVRIRPGDSSNSTVPFLPISLSLSELTRSLLCEWKLGRDRFPSGSIGPTWREKSFSDLTVNPMISSHPNSNKMHSNKTLPVVDTLQIRALPQLSPRWRWSLCLWEQRQEERKVLASFTALRKFWFETWNPIELTY